MKKILSVLFLVVISVFLASGQESKWGVIDVSAAILQAEADYESAIETQLLMGSIVEVLEEDGYWMKVRSVCPPYEAWTTELTLSVMDEAKKKEYEEADKYVFTSRYSHIFESHARPSLQICDALMGCTVRIMKDVNGKPVKKGNWLGVVLPSGKNGYVKRYDVENFAEWAESREATPQKIVDEAFKYLGVPYMWGGNTIEHVDCSGLTMMVYYMCGILLPRNASQQVKCGVEVSADELQKGDLLFYGREAEDGRPERISHVAIYIGEGRIIHASEKVRISSLEAGQADSYTRKILHIRRIIGNTENKVSSVLKNN